jgi:hypothetical protein
VTVSSYSTADEELGDVDADEDEYDENLPILARSHTLATAFFSSRLTQTLRGW